MRSEVVLQYYTLYTATYTVLHVEYATGKDPCLCWLAKVLSGNVLSLSRAGALDGEPGV